MDRRANGAYPAGLTDLTIKIVHDNNPYTEGFSKPWGFSAFVTGPNKNIIFDTGPDGPLLLGNMQKLAIDPRSIDVVFLSHIHPDHTGGLLGLLKHNPNVSVCLPKSFPAEFKANLLQYGAKIAQVEGPSEICPNVYSTGPLGKLIKEQALIVRTNKGLVVLTGCAHPGILTIIAAVQDFLNEQIFLLLGGFHLEWASSRKIEKVISIFKQCQVKYIAPCHCSGDKARELFEKHFGSNFINTGTGKVITLSALE